jgi:hypothetical protein
VLLDFAKQGRSVFSTEEHPDECFVEYSLLAPSLFLLIDDHVESSYDPSRPCYDGGADERYGVQRFDKMDTSATQPTLPSLVSFFAQWKPVPVTPNMTTTRPMGMNASKGTGITTERQRELRDRGRGDDGKVVATGLEHANATKGARDGLFDYD